MDVRRTRLPVRCEIEPARWLPSLLERTAASSKYVRAHVEGLEVEGRPHTPPHRTPYYSNNGSFVTSHRLFLEEVPLCRPWQSAELDKSTVGAPPSSELRNTRVFVCAANQCQDVPRTLRLGALNLPVRSDDNDSRNEHVKSMLQVQ